MLLSELELGSLKSFLRSTARGPPADGVSSDRHQDAEDDEDLDDLRQSATTVIPINF